MASTSTQTVQVPERPAERIEVPSNPRPVSRQPETRPSRFVIKLNGGIPT